MDDPGKAAVLIADASRTAGRRVLAYLSEQGYYAEWVDTAEKAYNRLDDRLFDVLVTALQLGHADGMRLMAVAKARNPDVCVVITTQEPDIERATEAMRQGAYDFQTKPLNLDKLEAVIERGLAYQRLVLEQVALQRRLDEQFGLGSLVGQSRRMMLVYSAVRELGPSQVPVLLHGEPGTGKDLIAQALHNSGPRRDAAFVKLDFAGLPSPVALEELCGAPGRAGRLELAGEGTLYLDNFDAAPLAAQECLLRYLETGSYARTPGGQEMHTSARLVAATCHSLSARVAEGRFLKALRDRFAPASIEAPALRTRREDIPLLARRALHEAAERNGGAERELTRDAVNLLLGYDWPGNVRELRNIVSGVASTARGDGPLRATDFPAELRRGAAAGAGEIRIPAGTPMREVERMTIEAAMQWCGHDKEKCAKTLGIGLRTLYRKLKEYEGA